MPFFAHLAHRRVARQDHGCHVDGPLLQPALGAGGAAQHAASAAAAANGRVALHAVLVVIRVGAPDYIGAAVAFSGLGMMLPAKMVIATAA